MAGMKSGVAAIDYHVMSLEQCTYYTLCYGHPLSLHVQMLSSNVKL